MEHTYDIILILYTVSIFQHIYFKKHEIHSAPRTSGDNGPSTKTIPEKENRWLHHYYVMTFSPWFDLNLSLSDELVSVHCYVEWRPIF